MNSASGPGTENADQGNLISGTNPNNGWGVWIDPASSGNVIAGNLMGTDASGQNSLHNAVGIYIQGSSNLVGTTGQDGADGFSRAQRHFWEQPQGVVITGATATGNVIAGNYIGTNLKGTAAIANNGDGVEIAGGASNNTIGGPAATPGTGAGNLISGNSGNGVEIRVRARTATSLQATWSA